MSQTSCCRCSSSIGDAVKVQPQNVTPVDGKGGIETMCPRCFVWVRMREEPERFNASQAAVAKCQFCQWVMVSFGARPGAGLRCFHCGREGAILLAPRPEDMAELNDLVRATQDKLRELKVTGKTTVGGPLPPPPKSTPPSAAPAPAAPLPSSG